jgi:hypothetical protein
MEFMGAIQCDRPQIRFCHWRKNVNFKEDLLSKRTVPTGKIMCFSTFVGIGRGFVGSILSGANVNADGVQRRKC